MRLYFLSFFLSILIITSGSASCGENQYSNENRNNNEQNKYEIYIINYSYHTGIVIPVNNESIVAIDAFAFFRNFTFVDIGWGEEKFYQNPGESYCMAARAILLPNRSVLRLEGYTGDDFIKWSKFVILLKLDKNRYDKLLSFINDSFTVTNGKGPIAVSKSSSEDVIFFESVYTYHLLNTCNTWIARALEVSGMDISPQLTITAGQLFDKIKDKGTILKGTE